MPGEQGNSESSRFVCNKHTMVGLPASVGTCRECSGDTISGAIELCFACAKKSGVCQICEEKIE